MSRRPQSSLRERVEATADPARFALVGALAPAPASARELADRSGIDLPKVRYVLRRWLAAGIVEEQDRGGPGRGGSRRYRLMPSALFIDNAEARGASRERLNQARSREAGLMLRRAMAIAGEGLYGVLNDHAAHKLPMTVDRPGREEALRAQEEAIRVVIEICEESSRRLGAGTGFSSATTVAIGFFERPQIRHSVLDRIDLAELAPKGRGPRNMKIPGDREDPLRLEIEYQLIVRPHTVAELVAELGVSASSVRRALANLERRSAVRVEAVRPTRGTVEKRWVGNPRAKYNAHIPGRPGDRERKDYEQRQIRIVAREMLASAQANHLGGPGATFAWLPTVLDSGALTAVHDEMARLAEKMLCIREECLDRKSWESEDGTPASSILMLFRHG